MTYSCNNQYLWTIDQVTIYHPTVQFLSELQSFLACFSWLFLFSGPQTQLFSAAVFSERAQINLLNKLHKLINNECSFYIAWILFHTPKAIIFLFIYIQHVPCDFYSGGSHHDHVESKGSMIWKEITFTHIGCSWYKEHWPQLVTWNSHHLISTMLHFKPEQHNAFCIADKC